MSLSEKKNTNFKLYQLFGSNMQVIKIIEMLLMT